MERSRFITIALIVLSSVSVLHARNIIDFDLFQIAVLILIAVCVHLTAMYCSTKRRLQPISPIISFVLLIVVLLITNADGQLSNAIPTIDSVIALIDDSRAGVIQMRTTSFPFNYSTEVFLVAIILSWVVAEIGETLAQRLHSNAPTLLWYIAVNAGLAANDSTTTLIATTVVICAASWFFMYAFEIGSESIKSHVVDIPKAAKITNLISYITTFFLIAALSMVAVLPLELPSYAPNDIFSFLNNSKTQSELSPLVGMSEQLRDEETQVLFTATANEVQYWRVAVLDDFDGESWSVSSNSKQEPEKIPAGVETRNLSASIQLTNLAAKFLPTFYSTKTVSSEDIDFLESGVIFSNNSKLTNYSITAQAPPRDLNVAQIEASSEQAPSSTDVSTLLPVDFDEEIIALSQSIVSNKSSVHEQAISLRDFFLDGSFVYDLEVDYSSSTNAMQEFLEKRRGFCEQFATTYAAMARSVGIPARVVVGFSPGALDANGRFTVTNKEAHSWVEVYLSNFGWLTIDPTPSGPLPGQTPTNIGQPVSTTTTTTTSAQVPTSAPNSQTAPATTQARTQPVAKSQSDNRAPIAIGFLVLLLVCAIVVYELKNRRKKGSNTEAYIVATFKEIGEKVLDLPPSPDLTISELANRVPDDYETIKEFLALLTLASYAPNGEVLLEKVKIAAEKARAVKIEKGELKTDMSKDHADHAMALKD